jgi:hypothetical protein
MTEREDFLHRWSRLKREGRAPDEEARPVATPSGPANEPPRSEPPEFNPDSLPPIESLGPESDYTVFLKRGVPFQLQLQGLRKAWVTDPRISEFRGMADYDWDFNAPGYGKLLSTDDAARWMQALFNHDEPKPPAETPRTDEVEPTAAPVVPPTEAIVAPPSPELPASAAAPQAEPVRARRKHGSAMPV